MTNPYRLARHVVPQRYDLTFTPNLESATFSGSQIVDIEVLEATSEITLNAAELVVGEAWVTGSTSATATITYDEEMERATFSFDQELPSGNYQLQTSFTGLLNDQLRGFYLSTFTDAAGNEQRIATTQFEAADARRAFPCWDEPDFKATFKITMVVPDHLYVVSNGSETHRQAFGENHVKVSFAETMIMSTYIVAFVVGPFEATEPVDIDGIPLRVIAPIGKSHLTSFALEAGEFCLRYLSDYYGIPYPGDKVDFIAIPDFAFGAMENLGAITYRETALLVDPTTTGLSEQRRIVDVIAHELAHMWFGDLVTMGWWEGIWLNEAFASFMEMKTTEAMHPEWNRWMAFAVDPGAERYDSMQIDALSTTRPVEFPVQSPEECNEMFDALTYGKGSAVLRMMEMYLGVEVFREGVGTYLKRHAYSNTVTSDLWAGLDAASGQPIGTIMDTWILQGGYPRVDVDVTSDGLSFRQSRFTLLPDTDEAGRLWQIPMMVKVSIRGDLTTHRVLMTDYEMTMDLDGPIDWVVANATGYGYYRVRYSHELLERLHGAISQLESLERFTILEDTFSFAKAGQLVTTEFLDLAGSYRGETEQTIWQLMIGHLERIGHILPSQAMPGFESWVHHLISGEVDRLGWEPQPDESDLTRLHRGQIMRALGAIANDASTIEIARRKLNEAISDPTLVDPDIANAALMIVSAHGTDDDYARIMEVSNNAKTPHQQLRYLQAASSFDDERSAEKTMAAVMGGDIRTQDSAWVVARMLTTKKTGSTVWKNLKTHWDDLVQAIPTMMVRSVLAGLPALSEPELAEEIHAFFAETEVVGGEKALAQTLENLDVNVAWAQRDGASLARYFTPKI